MPVRYEKRTLQELRSLAKDRGMSGYSSLKKKELIKRLRNPRAKRYSPKFERCVMAVKKRQPKGCEKTGYTRKGCYNPWAICYTSLK